MHTFRGESFGFPQLLRESLNPHCSCPSGTSNTNPADPPTSLRKISSPLHSALIKNPLVCLTLCLNPRIASKPPQNSYPERTCQFGSNPQAPFSLFRRESLYNQLHKKLHKNSSTVNSTLHPIVSRNPSGQRFNEDHTRRVFRYTSLALSVSKQRPCRH